jgi:hypothetical protein
MVYPDRGKIVNVRISGGDYDTISVNGTLISARHFVVMADKRQDVWLDGREIPVTFRTVEKGAQIDLVLQNVTAAGANTDASVRPPALDRSRTATSKPPTGWCRIPAPIEDLQRGAVGGGGRQLTVADVGREVGHHVLPYGLPTVRSRRAEHANDPAGDARS